MEKSNKRAINIIEQDGKIAFKLEGPFTAEDVILICNTVCLSAMNQLVESYTKTLNNSIKGPVNDQIFTQKLSELKGMLYDFYNVNASNVLKAFAPELEQHPDLTEQAILKAENELIEQKYEELKKENKIVPFKTPPKAKKLPTPEEISPEEE